MTSSPFSAWRRAALFLAIAAFGASGPASAADVYQGNVSSNNDSSLSTTCSNVLLDSQESPATDHARARKLDAAAAAVVDEERYVPMDLLREQTFRQARPIALPGSQDRRWLSSSEVYRRAKPAVWVVGRVYKCNNCPNWHLNTASGFAIDPSGLIVTNFHVIDYAPSSAVTLAAANFDGEIFPVQEVVSASREHDLAVLKIDAENLPTLSLAQHTEIGATAYVLGHPARRFYTFTRGMVSRAYQSQWAGEEIPLISVTAEYGQGSSGGPVLDEHGDVIGIVTRTAPINAHSDDGKPQYAQMIERQCVPVESLHALLRGDLPAATQPAATQPVSTEPPASTQPAES